MLRIGFLASTIPLLLAGLFAGGGLSAGARPCLVLGDGSLQIAPTPWQAGFQVSFTDDPARASARVQIVDQPEAADFAVTDDIDAPEPSACAATPARMIGIAASGTGADALIYLSRDVDADYRIFVRSTRITVHEAAALVVAADAPTRAVTASLAGGF
jgi:hypothetical protein